VTIHPSAILRMRGTAEKRMAEAALVIDFERAKSLAARSGA
jgi:hypothetical protein